MFKPVPSKVSFPRMEEDILKFWREKDIFHRTESEREGGPLFMMYEGPPTANGSPGIHHVLARIFKDAIPRYKTMKGFRTIRKGGWDTHGLPVELEVERELGLSTKQEIERFGVEEFNARCRESVFRYVKEWVELTERIAFWVDMKNAYATLTNDYIETGWWILKQLWDHRIKGEGGQDLSLLFKNFKVTPHCPRCVTTLSSHEVALGYEENTPDPSVYVKFLVTPGWWPRPLQALGNRSDWRKGEKPSAYDAIFSDDETSVPTYFLAWTTTPWTLPGNTALAIHPKEDYALIEHLDGDGRAERLILAADLADKVVKGKHQVLTRLHGEDLVGLAYQPLYDPQAYQATYVESLGTTENDGVWRLGRETLAEHIPFEKLVDPLRYLVIGQDIVSVKEGTGILHIAPPFGGEDYQAGQGYGLFFIQPVNLQGQFEGSYPWSGKFVKEADKDIRRDLRERGLLHRDETIRHTYPFCWRCGTPLLYYAKSSWYIRTTAVKDRLLSANQEINWHPEHIKDGRFGEWLQNNVDWAISRERFWGTPIPIWRCEECGEEHCVGSIAEIKAMANQEETQKEGISLEEALKDLHRPYIDKVALRCPQCGGPMRRIPEVLDAWFDSGAMPYAQWHYPLDNGGITKDGRYPADYICEAVDQTRGWFYSLHALSTLLEEVTGKEIRTPGYRNVICLGLIQDAKGEKMSKSKGNIVEPWAVIEAHGVDALRWYLYTAAPPGNSRRFSQELVGEAVRRFMLTLWNTYSFFVTYANIDRFQPGLSGGLKPSSELDRWILSELNSLILNVTELLDNYNPTDAGRRIEDFVEALSNWYVRRSRRRFWKSENDEDKLSAHSTLYRCLVTLSKLIAPLTPFVAEEMYQNLVRSMDPSAPESVHLSRFPEVDLEQIDAELSQATRLAMRLSSLGRSARSKAKIKVRQPIARALVKVRSPEEAMHWPKIKAQVEEELNVKEALLLDDPQESAKFFDVRLNMALVGPKFGAETGQVAKAFAAADHVEVYAKVSSDSPIEMKGYTLQPEEVEVLPAQVEGYAAATEAGYLVAVETDIPEDLRREGMARELVHRIQNMRRSAGFDIADYILTYYEGVEEIKEVMKEFGNYIGQETLSRKLLEQRPPDDAYVEEMEIEGSLIRIGINREIAE